MTGKHTSEPGFEEMRKAIASHLGLLAELLCQEMYGELIRDGMYSHDRERLEASIDALRAALTLVMKGGG